MILESMYCYYNFADLPYFLELRDVVLHIPIKTAPTITGQSSTIMVSTFSLLDYYDRNLHCAAVAFNLTHAVTPSTNSVVTGNENDVVVWQNIEYAHRQSGDHRCFWNAIDNDDDDVTLKQLPSSSSASVGQNKTADDRGYLTVRRSFGKMTVSLRDAVSGAELGSIISGGYHDDFSAFFSLCGQPLAVRSDVLILWTPRSHSLRRRLFCIHPALQNQLEAFYIDTDLDLPPLNAESTYFSFDPNWSQVVPRPPSDRTAGHADSSLLVALYALSRDFIHFKVTLLVGSTSSLEFHGTEEQGAAHTTKIVGIVVLSELFGSVVVGVVVGRTLLAPLPAAEDEEKVHLTTMDEEDGTACVDVAGPSVDVSSGEEMSDTITTHNAS